MSARDARSSTSRPGTPTSRRRRARSSKNRPTRQPRGKCRPGSTLWCIAMRHYHHRRCRTAPDVDGRRAIEASPDAPEVTAIRQYPLRYAAMRAERCARFPASLQLRAGRDLAGGRGFGGSGCPSPWWRSAEVGASTSAPVLKITLTLPCDGSPSRWVIGLALLIRQLSYRAWNMLTSFVGGLRAVASPYLRVGIDHARLGGLPAPHQPEGAHQDHPNIRSQ